MELLGKSQLYSSFLADQFKDVVEKTLETASAQELPAKRKKFSRGKGGAGPRGATAAQVRTGKSSEESMVRLK